MVYDGYQLPEFGNQLERSKPMRKLGIVLFMFSLIICTSPALTSTKSVVKKIIDRISDLKEVEKVIVFGAVARGTADRMSDIDILVVGKDVMKLQAKTSKIAYDCRTGKLFKQRFEVNIRVITPEELDEPRGFIKDAVIEGIMLQGD